MPYLLEKCKINCSESLQPASLAKIKQVGIASNGGPSWGDEEAVADQAGTLPP